MCDNHINAKSIRVRVEMSKNSSGNPLAEVFGFPVSNFSPEASRHRNGKLCPFNNKVRVCTKASVTNPLGVCCVFEKDKPTIICPIRFREDWIVAKDAARFFFPLGTEWITLPEVRLMDGMGETAGNIDLVLVAHDDSGLVTDFGSLEIQAVYISGNIRHPFEHYMKEPERESSMNWRDEPNYPRPDYLSSSRKRLVPQLLYKGTILKAWGKKQAVALHRSFYDTLPKLPQVHQDKAEMAWFIYGLRLNPTTNRFHLEIEDVAYTEFLPALEKIITPPLPNITEFRTTLQGKLDTVLDKK